MKKSNIIIFLVVIIFIASISFMFFKPSPVEVETAMVVKGIFKEELRADGFFRAKKRHTITAYGEGDIKRVDFKAGDLLKKNQVITEIYWDVKYEPVRSPIAGVITKIYRDSAGPIHRGEAILEVVDLDSLELVAELLTTDATRVKVGYQALASGWGEEKNIQAHVSKISKAGFTKISALGVEEEKTEVIMEPENLSAEDKTKLGHNFHTEVTITLATIESALKIPTGALLREGSQWAVYQVIKNKAVLRPIAISLRGNDEVVISSGLSEGDLVINYPGDSIKNGTLVKIK